MIFTLPQINDFLTLSGDTNPLHADDAFARKAGFEKRLVPGMLAVQSSMHPTLPAKSLKAAFNKPLHHNVDYKTGLDMTRDYFWFGKDEARVSVWRDCKVLTKHWAASDEEYVGEYCTARPVPLQSAIFCWISWFVGTQLPGPGGILAGIEIEFMKDGNPITDTLSFAVRIAQQKFGMIVMDAVLGDGDPSAYCEIRAMEAKR